jgi:hypothetical protein
VESRGAQDHLGSALGVGRLAATWIADQVEAGPHRSLSFYARLHAGVRVGFELESGKRWEEDAKLAGVMRGLRHDDPAQAKYSTTFDVRPVADAVRGLGGDGDEEGLRAKAVVLLAIALCARSSDVQRIVYSSIKRRGDNATLVLWRPKSVGVQGCSPRVTIHGVTNDRGVDPVEAMWRYIECTRDRRPGPEEDGRAARDESNRLFLALRNAKDPRKPVGSVVIAKLIKGAMREAGVPDEFGAHAIRSAALSTVLEAGATLEEAMQYGRWTSVDVVRRHYDRASQFDPGRLLWPRVEGAEAGSSSNRHTALPCDADSERT